MVEMILISMSAKNDDCVVVQNEQNSFMESYPEDMFKGDPKGYELPVCIYFEKEREERREKREERMCVHMCV